MAKKANNEINLDKILISMDETHHLYGRNPLYQKRFKSVMSFHSPGIAAVLDDSGSYHINLNGEPIYNKRFLKTFGYYENIAAIMDESGWYHINMKGVPIYKERYEWVGNFQEERCVVRDNKGNYFHIKVDGSPAYVERYKYIGDYKYGIAVVYDSEGNARHIDKEGYFINEKKFQELGVFHKGYATAKDTRGAFHVNKKGKPLYNQRFQCVEPFYNGYAFVSKSNGEKLIINDKGDIFSEIYNQESSNVKKVLNNQLKGMLVSYWKTQIIYSIVKLQILDLIEKGNITFNELLSSSQLPRSSLKMIIQVLKIWDFISEENGIYSLKFLGTLLTENYPGTLKYASLMWGSEHYQSMSRLTEALKSYQPQFEQIFEQPIFDYFNQKIERGIIYDKAMKAYTLDYKEIIREYDFMDTDVIMDVGGGSGRLLEMILSHFSHIKKGILFDLPSVIENARKLITNNIAKNKIEFISGNFFEEIPRKVDTITMSRILHDWNDENALKILDNIHNALEENGKLLLFEQIVPDNPDYDLGVTLNFNLLVNTGGKERTYDEYNNLLQKAGFKIDSVKIGDGIISIIIAEKIR